MNSIADIAWSAGIIDGEGTISIFPRYRSDAIKKGTSFRNHGYCMRVSASNTDPRIIRKLAELWGGSFRLVKSNRSNRSPCWHWVIAAKKALVVVEQITPYLVCKKEQAILAISFQSRMVSGRNALSDSEIELRKCIFEEMKQLNLKSPTRYEKYC